MVTLAETGGVASYAQALLPGLAEDFEVVVAARGDGPLRQVAAKAGMRSVELRHMRRSVHPVRDVLAMVELVGLIRRHRPDIVHAHSAKAGILGRLAAWFGRVPVRMLTVHGWSFTPYSPPARWLYVWLERLARPVTDAVVCPAHAVRATGLAERTCEDDRTVVIHNAVEVGGFARSTHPPGPPLVVSVGRLAFPKDFATLVRSIAMVEPRALRTAIVGDGPQRIELEQQIATLGVQDGVRLLGTRDDVPALLAEAGIFVLSSRSEGLPMSVIEAMAAGLPVVATAVGGIPELVEHERTGILVPPGDARALAAALSRLAGDAGLRQRMGEAGRARAEEHFDVNGFRRAHVELYARAARPLSGRPRPPGAPRSTRS